jgi:hypothetical protein
MQRLSVPRTVTDPLCQRVNSVRRGLGLLEAAFGDSLASNIISANQLSFPHVAVV